jgi:hypothetical protein
MLLVSAIGNLRLTMENSELTAEIETGKQSYAKISEQLGSTLHKLNTVTSVLEAVISAQPPKKSCGPTSEREPIPSSWQPVVVRAH